MDERNISYGWIDECQEARRERFWDVRDILRDLPAHVLESWAEHGEMPRPTMPVTLSREHATALWLKRETVWGDELIAQVLSDVRTRYIEYFAPILHLAPTAWLDFMRLSHAGAILSDHRARIAWLIPTKSDGSLSGNRRSGATRRLRLFDLALDWVPTDTTNRVCALLLPIATGFATPPTGQVTAFVPRPPSAKSEDVWPMGSMRARHAERADRALRDLAMKSGQA